MDRCIIAAVADNGAIGRNNGLMWHLAEDMKYFRRQTLGCPVIMGRKTYESIGRPLPNRQNIIVSKSLVEAPEGFALSPSLASAFATAEVYGAEKCFVIGGGQIYHQAMESADILMITHGHVSIEEADTFFPEISPEEWEERSRSETATDPETGYRYEFAIYTRRR